MAVAVLGGHLYAIGGSDGTMPLETVERWVLWCADECVPHMLGFICN